MIQRISALLFFLLSLGSVVSIKAQDKNDLFSKHNSSTYANYLFEKGDYDLSFVEYKRLVYLDSSNVFFKTRLLSSAYKSSAYKKGIREARTFYRSDSLFPQPIAKEFVYLLLNGGYKRRVSVFLKSNHTFSLEENLFYSCANELLAYDIPTARMYHSKTPNTISSLRINNLGVILNEAEQFKPKSKFLAGAMSSLLPGSGKVYSGEWRDGLFAFLYTSVAGYQSIRGFRNKGIKSLYGWAFASIGTGFYLGNVYGSVKSITKRRNNHRLGIINQTKNVLARNY